MTALRELRPLLKFLLCLVVGCVVGVALGVASTPHDVANIVGLASALLTAKTLFP